MGTEIETSTTFQTRMFGVIREKMGDLLTDEELKQILEISIHKAFFDEPIIRTDQWGHQQKGSPLIVGLVRDAVRDRVNLAVDTWAKDHADDVGKILDGVIRDGIVMIVQKFIADRTEGPLDQLRAAIESRFKVAIGDRQ